MKESAPLAIVTHGGAGADKTWQEGCQKAADAGLAVLLQGGEALTAAVHAAVILEDDGRFNAGSGSRLRLDGQTVEMDAALMDSRGHLASVAALTGVKNPILVAKEVLGTPHVFLAGQGALDFARRRGFPPHTEISDTAREIYRQVREALARGDFSDIPAVWRGFDLPAYWNFPDPLPESWAGCDTIGVVARDRHGHFAVAASTGGSSPMLRGRVGDTPLIGCGFYAGPYGAVGVTGVGEEIIQRMLAREVYDRLVQGVAAPDACEAGIQLFAEEVPVGIIAVSAEDTGVASNRAMPFGVAVSG